MKKPLQLLLFFLFLNPVVQASPATQHIPENFTATFVLYKSGFPIAETQYRLTRDKKTATFLHVSKPSGFTSFFSENKVEEQSTLDISENSIKVKKYQLTQTGDKNISISSTFNWNNKTISTINNKQAATKTHFEHYLWDKLSTLLALISYAHDQSKSIFLQSFDGVNIKKYELKYAGQKEIELDDDEWIRTDIWKREDGKKQVIFYLNPDENYFPVKIEQFKHQKLRATLLLKELKWL